MALGFFLLLAGFILCDLMWWRLADRRLRLLRGASFWRIALGILMSALLGYLVCSRLVLRMMGRSEAPIPIVVHAFVYIWHFLVLPASMMFLSGGAIVRRIGRFIKSRRSRQLESGLSTLSAPAPAPAASDFEGAERNRMAPTRRQVVAAVVMAAPPLAAAAIAAAAVSTMYRRRLRRFTLWMPELPPALDGMTLAHISDTHIGKFLHHDRLPAIADTVNALDADFVVFTGDLIDLTLADLPFGIDFLRGLKQRCGLVVCEGNHDLMEGADQFRDQMKAVKTLPDHKGQGNFMFIASGEKTITYDSRDGTRSHAVQFLAVPWVPSDEERSLSVHELPPPPESGAFRILLAHHPHTFDAAAGAGIPLVLSGHTHGGQMMLTKDVGIASIRFRYTSGHYAKPGSNLIVNNGLGNWFPLRINAPAEIVKITLRHGATLRVEESCSELSG